MDRPSSGVNLHLLHSWGGGLQRWVRSFAAADRGGRNLVLCSVGTLDAYGLEMALWDAGSGEELRRWALQEPICEIALHNPEYAAILESLVAELGVEHLYVGSLIGQSLDALDTGVPTTLVHHDFFPFCPGLNLFFGGTCRACTAGDLERCLASNPCSHLFRNNPAGYWLRVRERYFELLAAHDPAHVCPLPWVRDALAAVDARFAGLRLEVIEHGIDMPRANCFGGGGWRRRLRLVHLGRVNEYKGLPSLRALLPRLRLIADVTLLGAGEGGKEFVGMAGVEVVPDYEPSELGGWLQRLRPDAALFLSAVPETYSFTLTEAFLHGIPVLGHRLGAFAARVEHRRSGLLFDTDEECLAQLLAVDRSRSLLRQMARRIRHLPRRNAADMVSDYHRLRAGASAEAGAAAVSSG